MKLWSLHAIVHFLSYIYSSEYKVNTELTKGYNVQKSIYTEIYKARWT